MAPRWFRRELQPGMTGQDVAVLQRMLGHTPDGRFDVVTAHAVRGWQKANGQYVTGVVDAGMAEMLGESSTSDLMPRWFYRVVYPGTIGDDVRTLRMLMALPDDNLYDREVEDAVRRLQSSKGVTPTGVVAEDEALLIGDVEIDTAPEG